MSRILSERIVTGDVKGENNTASGCSHVEHMGSVCDWLLSQSETRRDVQQPIGWSARSITRACKRSGVRMNRVFFRTLENIVNVRSRCYSSGCAVIEKNEQTLLRRKQPVSERHSVGFCETCSRVPWQQQHNTRHRKQFFFFFCYHFYCFYLLREFL